MIDLAKYQQFIKNRGREIDACFKKLKNRKPKDLDTITLELHEKAFEEIDCLECANCCKSISPIITYNDIERIAKQTKQKPGELVEKYMHMDSDGDYVFNSSPCPFLGADNYCSIYSHRPKACREYPHTDRRRFYQILDLTRKNCEICPIVCEVSKGLLERCGN
ncbi:MAG: YkgJ family cysteine cluster protein [Bacteroidales bacterium]